MSLTATSQLESARRKCFYELEVHHVQKPGIKRFWAQEAKMTSGGRNECNSHQLARISEKKIFHELDVHHVQKVGIKRFWAQEAKMSSGGRNESNSHKLARIGETKIFHELDVHHVQKVGIKGVSAQEAEMSLIAISSLQSAREKFFKNSTYIMSRKQESNVFGLRRSKLV